MRDRERGKCNESKTENMRSGKSTRTEKEMRPRRREEKSARTEEKKKKERNLRGE